MVRVANAEMVRALRVISVERGLDPREFALVAFGGAGGMHACALAEELGIATILVPRAGGVLSALGLAISDLRRDYVRPFPSVLEDARREDVERAFVELERRAATDLRAAAGPAARRPALPAAVVRADGGRRRSRRAGPALPRCARAALRVPDGGRAGRAGEPARGGDGDGGQADAARPDGRRRPARTACGGRTSTATGRRCRCCAASGMGAGAEVAGPAIVEFAEATCVVRPGWHGAMDEAGTLVLERPS